MNDTPPNDPKDVYGWYRYFRHTKFIPGMPMKFKDTFNAAASPEEAKVILTTYTATALDILINYSRILNTYLVEDLEKMFELTPDYLTYLSVKELADCANFKPEWLENRLSSEGFKIEKGIILGFADPFAPKKPAVSLKPFQ